MSEVLSQTHPYIQLEEATKSSINYSLKPINDKEKMNSQYETPTHAINQNRGQPALKKQTFPILSISTPSLQSGTTLHLEVPHQQSLQCHQRPII